MPNREWGPVVFTDDSSSAVLARALKRGTLQRLARGIYSGETDSAPEDVVRRNLLSIVAHEYPGAIVADRSVPDGGVTADGALFVVHERRRSMELPGVVIHPRQGPSHMEGDAAWPEGLWFSSRERALLDNLVKERSNANIRRTLTSGELEDWLEHLMQDRGAEGLNLLRDHARRLAPWLGREKQFHHLDRLVAAMLSTGPEIASSAPTFVARLSGFPYDNRRLSRFKEFAAFLQDRAPASLPALPIDGARRKILPFYEAYFSNFIEGTEFELDDAADIVFSGGIPANRTADAHDILGTYEIVSDSQEMCRVPSTHDDLETLLLERHAVLMKSRPEMGPGQWKSQNNRAGSTVFVDRDLVRGTLRHGFEAGEMVSDPFSRAVFMMFLVAEIHPFADGNGRIARVMMNAELESRSEARIIIPTVFRENYLSALRGATFNGNFLSLTSALDFAHRWTARINFSDRKSAESDLMQTNALRDSLEAERSGVHLTLPEASRS